MTSSFWWRRFEVTKEKREWTALRMAAAGRAVQREADAMPLFPELRRVHTIEQRMSQMDERTARITAQLRDGRAEMWWRARRFLRGLPADDKARLLAKWNTRFMPGDPANLFATASLIGIKRETKSEITD